MKRLSICLLALLSGCAAPPSGPMYVSPEDKDFGELVAEKGSVWGAVNGKVATTAIKEVDGLPFEGYRHPIKIDDKIRLRPGEHSIGVRLWGSPVDFRVGHESYVCLQVTVRAMSSYVLRGGFFDQEHFRLEVVEIYGEKEHPVSAARVPLDVKRREPICQVNVSPVKGAI
jgi:hypothetical protein